MLAEWLESLTARYGANAVPLIAFWGFLALLAGLEALIPAFRGPQARPERWPTNLGLGLINAVLAPLAPLSAVAAAEWAAGRGFGLIHHAGAPWWIAAPATVLAYSFANYAIHVLMHRTPPLWRLHRVHHSDTVLDVSTGFRTHPAAFVVSAVWVASVAAVLGLMPWVVMACETLEALVGVASHANLRLPDRLDQCLRWVVVTPNMHSLHHSAHRPETDSNYGTVLTLWDRMFGTYRDRPADGYDNLRIGLDGMPTARAASFWSQLALFATDPGPAVDRSEGKRRGE